MSLTSSIYTSVSGMNAIASGLSVLGDNLANTNTVGFKNSRALFGDILSQEMDKSGSGVMLQKVDTEFNQGTLSTTSNPLDFAIDGGGFFIVKDLAGKEFYTRAGIFSPDSSYSLVTPEGMNLQGYLADNSGNITTTVGNIQIPLNPVTDSSGNIQMEPTMLPAATTTASMAVNLYSNSETPSTPWSLDPASGAASGASNFDSSVDVYDSSGNKHTVDVLFRKVADNTWDAHVVWNNGKSSNNYQEQVIPGITFDGATGQLVNPAGQTPVSLTWDAAWGVTSPQTVTLGLDNTTQYGTPNSVMFLSADGYAEGGLTTFRTDASGRIYGEYSNGREHKIAQICLAQFNEPKELRKMGNHLFAESDTSGVKAVSAPGDKGAGSVSANSLEMSNVDMASEFVTMISLQRAFQANTMVMSTTNEMYTRLTNL